MHLRYHLPDIIRGFVTFAKQSTQLPARAQRAASSRRVSDGGATGVTGSSSRGKARDNSDPHDGSHGGGPRNNELTAADFRAALEEKPELMTDSGLVWVEHTRGDIQAE